jgi:hypothetical protein
MEFFIRKNATLPVLKMQVVQDGRSTYGDTMELLELATIFFSMVDVKTGIPKIVGAPCSIVSLIPSEPGAPTEYYIYYQFTSRQTDRPGRYQGQFLIKNSGLLGTQQGSLIVPIREELYINIEDSFISEQACC